MARSDLHAEPSMEMHSGSAGQPAVLPRLGREAKYLVEEGVRRQHQLSEEEIPRDPHDLLARPGVVRRA